jgi:membrane associated rhomboid family serine protease
VTITLLIIAVTCLVSFAGFGNRALLERLLLWPPAVKRGGEAWRLVTYGLVHADGQHLLFNMITLFFFGRVMEEVIGGLLGPWGYVGFYVSALVVSILPTYLANVSNPEYRSLGASGAVSAVLFAYILLAPWTLIFVFFLPVPAILFAVAYIAYSVWSDRRGQDNVNHSAHLWGAGYGVLFLLLLDPRVLPLFLERLANP